MQTPYRKTFARLLGFLRPYRVSLILSVLLAAGSQAAQIAFYQVVGSVIDKAIKPNDRHELWVLIGVLLALGITKAALMVGRRFISGNQALGVEYDIRDAFYARLLRLSFGFYDSHQTGQLMSRATVDLQQVRFFLGYGLIFVSQHILTVVGVTAVMLWLDWQLALIALAITPFLVVIAYRYSHVSHPLLRDVQQKLADVATVSEESIVGVGVVKAFAQEPQEAAKFADRSERLFRRTISANRQRALYVPLMSFLPMVAQAAVLLVGGAAVVHGSLQLGQFVSFNLFVTMLVGPLRQLGTWIGTAQRATASGERIFEIIDEPEEVADRPGATDLPAGGGRIQLQGVTFAYAPGRPVLEEIDLELRPGSTVALIGHTGAGKTTLASLVPRFYDATAGRVLVDGVDVRDLRLSSLRRAIGVIAQDPFLFSTTVRENIALGKPDVDDEEVEHAARMAQAHEFIDGAAARLRDGDRRARDHALGRPAPADRDRAGAPRRPPDPDPRRRDGVGGRVDRGPDQARPARGDEGPDDDDHRPPPLDDRARRRDRRARARAHRRPRHRRRAVRDEPRLPRDPRARPAREQSAVAARRVGGDRMRVWQPGSSSPDPRGAKVSRLVVARRPRAGSGARAARPPVQGADGDSRSARCSSRPGSRCCRPFLAKLAIDDGIPQKDLTRARARSSPRSSSPGCSSWGASSAQTYFTGWTGERVLADLRRSSSGTCSGSRSATTSATAPA